MMNAPDSVARIQYQGDLSELRRKQRENLFRLKVADGKKLSVRGYP